MAEEKGDGVIGKDFEEERTFCLRTEGAEEAERGPEEVALLMVDCRRYLRDLTELALHIFISNLTDFWLLVIFRLRDSDLVVY